MPRIDTENIEIGGVFGALSIEDFGTNSGVRRRPPPITSPKTSFSRRKRAVPRPARRASRRSAATSSCLPDDERQFTYYNLALGYNFLPGEVFLGRNTRHDEWLLSCMGGIGSVDFAGDQKFAVTFGAGYRVLPTDWLGDPRARCRTASSIRTCWARSKLTNNLEANIGLTDILREEGRLHETLNPGALSARSDRRSLLRALVALAGGALALAALAAAKRPAPDFALDSNTGKPIKLSGLKGQVVMINFWATWCGPAGKEMPLLDSIYKQYKDKELHPARRERRAGSEAGHRLAEEAAGELPGAVRREERRQLRCTRSPACRRRCSSTRRASFASCTVSYKDGDENEYMNNIRMLMREK